MTAQGAERPPLPESWSESWSEPRAESLPEPDDGQLGSDCDDPFTRLLLLLEIAKEPAWLRDLSRPPA
ncbi:hypothetical protein [Streptomyces sp. ODS28]|uniref:hypothetical protein n=1 Tax=Streptomyces sp. ODS28 TaxID=3136688 RepID=UPI0031E9B982